jgi:beta-mannosidase
MTRRVINLNDDQWHFGQVSARPFSAADVYDLPTVTEWLPATVPGNVRTDLLALDRIPDPYFDQGYKESLWVEDVDWWYRRVIRVDPLAPTERAFVVLAGIDYLSAIFINGQEVTRHEGMFSRQIIEITGALQSGGGSAEIAVRLWGSSALPRRHLTRWQRAWQKIAGMLHRSWVGVYPDRSATLKCQMSFGWDFAPPIRTMGLWDDVQLVITGPVFIEEASVVGTPHQPLPNKGRSGRGDSWPTRFPATFSLNLTLDTLHPRQIEVVVLVTPANFKGPPAQSVHFDLDVPARRSRYHLQFDLPHAALWQPWDRGQPHLYNLTITLTEPEVANNSLSSQRASDPRNQQAKSPGHGPGSSQVPILDEVKIRTGVRSIEIDRWQFSVNGRREFIRGLNWVPADCFPGRLRPADYTRLLTMARDSGANLIRVWGGGLREKQAFYNLCDQLGLLVWQEFPFACMFLGSYPRHQAYLTTVEAECSAIVRQLRHHPSLILWCGGNEFSRRRNRPLLDTLATVVDRLDGSRPFIPVSPSFDHGHDAHNWLVWHGQAPIRLYQAETAHFLSEFGLQALSHLDTLTAALPHPADPQSWPSHQADPQKLVRYASLFNNQAPIANDQFTIHHSSFSVHHSQHAQAIALQTAIEHMRRGKGRTGGVCLWQFNEPWPTISWAIVDYFGRPKLAYKRLATWYNPVLVSLKFPVGQRWQPGQTFTAEIWAINDTLQPIINDQSAGLVQLLITLDDTPVHTQTLDLPADSAQCVGRLTHPLTASPHSLNLTLSHGPKTLCQNSYDLTWFDLSRASLAQRFRRRVADWVMW